MKDDLVDQFSKNGWGKLAEFFGFPHNSKKAVDAYRDSIGIPYVLGK